MAGSNRSEEQPLDRPVHPPPPADPFTRYQTPWPYGDKDEQNPFIQFRRFADEQFQSIFSGVPKLITAFSAGASAGADAFQREIDQMMQQRGEFEEGFKKQFEQDIEEQRQALQKLKQWHEQQVQLQPREQQEVELETTSSPWWQHGRAAKCPALEQMRLERARKCPVMYDRDGKPMTELDAYETMQAAHIGKDTEKAILGRPTDALSVDLERLTGRDECTAMQKQSNKWLSGVGFDGQRREQSTTHPSSSAQPVKAESQITTICRFASRWSRPFDNPHDTIPWLLVNQYSPVFLCNPQQPSVDHVKLQQGVNQPLRIIDTFYIPRGFCRYIDRREELAKQVPWADAFEDLLSLQQTGKMVDRDYSTYRTPKTWIHDMVQRGSLGPAWGFNEQGQLTKMLRESRDHKAETRAARHDDRVPGFFPPQPKPVDVIAAEMIAAASHAEQDEEQLARANMKKAPRSTSSSSSSAEEQASTAASVPPTESSWSSTTWSSGSETNNQKSDSITSSITTTERWTKSDGTVETRRVFKRRYSDGREVEEETHDFDETKKPERGHAITLEQAPWPIGPKELTYERSAQSRSSDRQTQTVTPVQDELQKARGRGGGWFWN